MTNNKQKGDVMKAPAVLTIRRAVRFAALAAMVLLAEGCGNTTTSPSASSSASSTQPLEAAGALIANAGKNSSTAFCGTKQITLGVNDGLGANSWSKTSMAAVRSEAARCPNVKQVVRVGLGSLQANISILNGFVAQGMNAIVTVPDFGKSELPAIQAATRAGVKVVAWGANPGGTPGKDYVAYVDFSGFAGARTLANWMAKAVHERGDLVFLGGPAGNAVTETNLMGIHAALRKYPHITLLTGYSDWAVTNWDGALQQSVMTSLLSKYPHIDGVLDDADGFDATGVLRAYQRAGKQMVPFATGEANLLACTYEMMKPKNPHFQLATISGRNWIGRIAARKAIAAAEGVPDKEPNTYNLPLYENTLGGPAPHCDKSAPMDAYTSAGLTATELNKYGKTS
jgi:ribose transport system substrate-binding protein